MSHCLQLVLAEPIEPCCWWNQYIRSAAHTSESYAALAQYVAQHSPNLCTTWADDEWLVFRHIRRVVEQGDKCQLWFHFAVVVHGQRNETILGYERELYPWICE